MSKCSSVEMVEEIGWGRYQALVATYLFISTMSAPAVVQSLVFEHNSQLHPDAMPLLVTSIFAGLFVGSLASGFLADSWGRRPTILLGSFVLLVAGLCCAIVPSVPFMFALRFVVGMGVGLLGPASCSLLAELSPTGTRAWAVHTLNVSFSAGQLLLALICWELLPSLLGQVKARVVTAAVCCPFLLLLPIGYFCLPESPAVLELTGRTAELEALLRKMAAWNGKDDVYIQSDEADAPVSRPSVGGVGGRMRLVLSRKYGATALVLTFVFVVCNFISTGVTYQLPQLFRRLIAHENSLALPPASHALAHLHDNHDKMEMMEKMEMEKRTAHNPSFALSGVQAPTSIWADDREGQGEGEGEKAARWYTALQHVSREQYGQWLVSTGRVPAALHQVLANSLELVCMLLMFLAVRDSAFDHGRALRILLALAMLAALALAACAESRSSAAAFPAAYVCKSACALLFALTFIYAAELFPSACRATGVALLTCTGRTGAFFSPTVYAHLFRTHQSDLAFLLLVACLCFVAWILAVMVALREPQRSDTNALSDIQAELLGPAGHIRSPAVKSFYEQMEAGHMSPAKRSVMKLLHGKGREDVETQSLLSPPSHNSSSPSSRNSISQSPNTSSNASPNASPSSQTSSHPPHSQPPTGEKKRNVTFSC